MVFIIFILITTFHLTIFTIQVNNLILIANYLEFNRYHLPSCMVNEMEIILVQLKFCLIQLL